MKVDKIKEHGNEEGREVTQVGGSRVGLEPAGGEGLGVAGEGAMVGGASSAAWQGISKRRVRVGWMEGTSGRVLCLSDTYLLAASCCLGL